MRTNPKGPRTQIIGFWVQITMIRMIFGTWSSNICVLEPLRYKRLQVCNLRCTISGRVVEFDCYADPSKLLPLILSHPSLPKLAILIVVEHSM